MIKKYLSQIFILIALCFALGLFDALPIQAQVTGPQEIKWIWVSSLRHWFSHGGAEIEYGRRGRAFLDTDQIDGLRWPAQFPFQDHNVGESVWIGTTNFTQNVHGEDITYPYKVVCSGRSFMFLNAEIFPEEISLIARSPRPDVFVDDNRASDLESYDEVDLVDDSIKPDRMILNKYHTTIGISVTRKVLAFTQQYHDNYLIYDYVFKNTGIVDNQGTIINRDLTGVVFHFQYRLSSAYEAFRGGWSIGNSNYAKNTINDAVGQDDTHLLPAPNDFRAVFSYYGPCSASTVEEDIGGPNHSNGFIMAGAHFMGAVVLHADKSAHDPTDDFSQPTTTQFMGSDRDAQSIDQFDATLMAQKYGFMTAGHPSQTHAEQVGKDANGWPSNFSDNWGGDPGGYAAAQGFGPYDLNGGDSIHIVIAQCIAGLNRDLNKQITRKWFNNSGPFQLPDSSTTTDRNIYKNTWVFTGKDSLFQTFRRALANYNSNYQIAEPPAPPNKFTVNSGGNRIALAWSASAETGNFNGYNLYRAEGRPDTTYELIFSCSGGADKANVFEDKSAKRGFNYYYYIQTKDNGTTNDLQSGTPLVSSKFYTMTNFEAFLTRPSGTSLSEIRVVPNPYNIKAKDIQFGQDTPDRLAFYGIPPYCVIKIFTETGDLIKTIDHSNGSGDELWDSLTSSNQLVVSGLYIAYFEVTRDSYENSRLIFKKGDNTFRKFIIIR